jgi:hypothetical protein
LLKKIITISILSLCLSGLASIATAGIVEEYFDILKNIPADYSTRGAVCEKVAILELEETWGRNDYTILNGVAYADGHRRIGELDIVILRKSDDEAVLIGEVKCSTAYGATLERAKEQLGRFYDFICTDHEEYQIYFEDNPSINFTKYNFNEDPEFITISQRKSIYHGFDVELKISLSQVEHLRQMLSHSN